MHRAVLDLTGPAMMHDLSDHVMLPPRRCDPVDFPVSLRPIFIRTNGTHDPIPHRVAVVREDTKQTLAVVSDRYSLVPHQRILDVVEKAITNLALEGVSRGVYLDHSGARMRAVFKFSTLAQPVRHHDMICPCLKIQNTYDGTARIGIQIGAFRVVCTNLAVGGAGAFAGGFLSVHVGEIPLDDVVEQLQTYLAQFTKILELYRFWLGTPLTSEKLTSITESLPKRPATVIQKELEASKKPTVFDGYNTATYYATHQMRSYRTAFALLDRINRSFQKHFALAGT
jgi:hypothetical protein